MKQTVFSFLAGFTLLFAVYHFPEFYNIFWLMAAFKIGFLAVAFILGRVQGWKGLEGYGLGLSRNWWRQLISGLLTGIIFFTLSITLAVLCGFENVSPAASAQQVMRQTPMLLLMTVFPSVAEDILTRGYLYGHLFSKLKPVYWVCLSAAVYVLNHIWRLTDDPSVLVYLFILGLVLAFTVWKTKSLWLAFGIHWGSNIAFESTNSFMKTDTIVSHHGSTWLLAVSWFLLLVLLIVVAGVKERRPVH